MSTVPRTLVSLVAFLVVPCLSLSLALSSSTEHLFARVPSGLVLDFIFHSLYTHHLVVFSLPMASSALAAMTLPDDLQPIPLFQTSSLIVS